MADLAETFPEEEWMLIDCLVFETCQSPPPPPSSPPSRPGCQVLLNTYQTHCSTTLCLTKWLRLLGAMVCCKHRFSGWFSAAFFSLHWLLILAMLVTENTGAFTDMFLLELASVLPSPTSKYLLQSALTIHVCCILKKVILFSYALPHTLYRYSIFDSLGSQVCVKDTYGQDSKMVILLTLFWRQ